MSVTPKSNQGRAAEVAVAIIASETTTISAPTNTLPVSAASMEEDLRRRAETITVVLEKILEPPRSLHWGINE
jgi:hypothetical protein